MNEPLMKIWKTSRREIVCSDKTLVMAILNVTPDSFSDGGKFLSIDESLRHAEKLISEGADILDIGGESTRPNSRRVETDEEVRRVLPVVEAVVRRFDTPVSVDTTKTEVARRSIEAGVEIINDISGLRFNEEIAGVAAAAGCGLVLMHSRGDFSEMHDVEPVDDVVREVSEGFAWSLDKAKSHGVRPEQICLDIGIGFSKTFGQNLELLGKLDQICRKFPDHCFLVGTSRKSFIGRILGDAPVGERLTGTVAANVVAVLKGAEIVRVHDVRETINALKVVDAIRREL